MQYMQKGGFQKNPMMRLTLAFLILFLAGFVVTNFLMYFDRMSWTPASVVAYYNGSEEEFRPARTYGSMLEVTHGHLPMMAIVLLMLTHLVIFAPFTRRQKISLISVSFLAALAEESGGWLVRFVHPDLAWVKIIGFFVLQGALIFLLCSLAIFLWRSARENGRARVETIEDIPTPEFLERENEQERRFETI